MLELTEQDLALLQDWHKYAVLRDLDRNLLDEGEGAMLVTCSDGNHFHDVFGHHRETKLRSGICRDSRIHPFSWHGGALRLAPNTPVNSFPNEDQVWMKEVVDGWNMGYGQVALYCHMRCKKATLCNVSSLEVVSIQMQTKKLVKQHCPGIIAACFLHVAYSPVVKRTSFIERVSWESWEATRAHLFR